jgi:thymidylate synthase (FAD)
MVRHRAGVAVSQESMRYVRLTDIPFWFPEWCRDDQELMDRNIKLLNAMEVHQQWMSDHFGLDNDDVPMHEKKAKTSFMRRFAPDGVSTGMLCTMNIRAIRHIIYMRTALGAEEEIRLVMDDVAKLALEAFPNLMQDYSPNENQEWIPEFLKV